MKKIFFFYFFLNFAAISVFSTTWDEPWHEQVVKESESFARIKIIESNGSNVKAKLIKNLAGEKLTDEFEIKGYYLLNLITENTKYPPEYQFKKDVEYYVFLKKGDKGNYLLSTPSSGWAKIDSENVIATYRHSYHKAIVPVDVYEKTMIAIFDNLKNLPYDRKYIDDLIDKYLNMEPYSPIGHDMKSTEANNFFMQHVAMECIYFLGDSNTDKHFSQLAKFADFDFFHTQISAIRALSKINTEKSKQAIFDFLNGSGDNFSKIIAIWALEKMNAKEYNDSLKVYKKNASSEKVYFETDIMDPRVGTYFPKSVKDAVDILLKKWD